ncbi:heterogeneous nuclear ribonucleoprotein 27C-like, partial [Tropilaelaps mercedesae]
MVDDKEVLCKMFVGGLSWDTTKEGLQSYFCRFGEIVDCVVMSNDQGRSRGFGFVTFKDPQVVQVVCQGGPHRIDNRVVDPKPCNPRGGPGKGGGKRGRGYPKIFVGGLPTSLSENELKQFFQEHYGDVFEVVIMYDQERRKSR